MCVDCLAADRTAEAIIIHHIKLLRDHPNLKYIESNLMGLCRACHGKRHARD
ncbi:MAG: HNH endonuclease [FCB group bacterium]|nr:HNH endonuclease [FCB group bacterium]